MNDHTEKMMHFRWEVGLMITLSLLLAWLAIGERMVSLFGGESEIAVQVVRVRKYSIPETLAINGALLPVSEIQVVSQLAGRVSELRVKRGDSVRAGAVIGTIHATDVASRQSELEVLLVSARKDLTAKERRLATAEQFAARRRELFRQDLIARRDLELAITSLETTRAETELARAQLAQQEAMLVQARTIQSFNQITAPSAGVISRLWVAPGALIGAASPIVSIANGQLVKFSGRISGAHATVLREGLSATVRVDENVGGIVSRVISRGADATAYAEIEILIKAPSAKIRFGMTAEAVITLEAAKESLRVPHSALFQSGGGSFVYKIAAGRAVRQAVQLGMQVGDEVVIESGVSVNDSVIVGDIDAIKTSSRVRAVEQLPPQKN